MYAAMLEIVLLVVEVQVNNPKISPWTLELRYWEYIIILMVTNHQLQNCSCFKDTQ